MIKNILKIIVVAFMIFGLLPNIAMADETTHEVKVTAKHENKTLSYVAVMIVENDETIAYETTNKNGVATFNLSDGTYTATVGYVSGNYSYYGTTEIIVNGQDTSVTINVDSEFTMEAAKEVYDSTTYYDHIDIRVNGTFTTGTEGNLVTHSIKLKNVELLVKNGETTLINTTFTDDTETYEWRVTGKKIPNTAVVSLIFDIVLDGTTVRENYVTSFSGEEAFIQAIINCDQNQGLDFIIDPTEIVEAALYDVTYVWIGLPEELAHVPGKTEHAPNTTHTIDTQFELGYIIVDENNNVKYTFSGWEEWSNAEDNHNNKNTIGTSTELIITNDTIIYGEWLSSPLTPTSNHIIIKKTFSGNDGRLPENLLFKVTNSNTEETYIIELLLNSFTYDETTETYTYYLPVYEVGIYTIEELNYTILGYTFDTSSSTETTQEVTTDLTQEVTVTFNNVYTKNKGVDFHNSGFIVEKADASNRGTLSGAKFTLTKQSGEIVSEVTTNDSGYAIFMNLPAGTYILKETSAPDGYHLTDTEYTVTITLLSSKEVYSATQNAYLTQYEYSVVITPDDHYNTNGSRLTVYNEKITGCLTISKEFGTSSKYNKENYPSNNTIEVEVTGPNNYSQKVVLDNTNNWTVSLNDLELGSYTIKELTTNATISGYNLNTTYTYDNNTVSTSATITLTSEAYTKEITITNTYTKIPEDIHNEVSFSVKKVDENSKVLSGATFGLYNLDNELISTKTTDETGIITFTGFNQETTYILKEISAPTNYNKVDTQWEIKILLENGAPSTETGDNVYNYLVSINNESYTDNTLTVVNEIKTGNIIVTKEVKLLSNNEIIEKTNDVKNVIYSFTVIIGDTTYNIELTDGESRIFENIPYGTTYEIYENIPEDATWTHTAPSNAKGIITSDETNVNMENVYNISNGFGEEEPEEENKDNNEIPQTGDNNSFYLYSLITMISMIGLIITAIKYNKNI